MKYFSLPFLNAALLIFTCSRIVIWRWDRLWPGELKWAPVDMLVLLFTTYPRCSASRYLRGLPVSPIYLDSLHFVFWHSIMYILFVFSHVNFLFRIHFPLLLNLTVFPSFTYGHAVHCFPHLNIPLIFLSGYGLGLGGTFALIAQVTKVRLPFEGCQGWSLSHCPNRGNSKNVKSDFCFKFRSDLSLKTAMIILQYMKS